MTMVNKAAKWSRMSKCRIGSELKVETGRNPNESIVFGTLFYYIQYCHSEFLTPPSIFASPPHEKTIDFDHLIDNERGKRKESIRLIASLYPQQVLH